MSSAILQYSLCSSDTARRRWAGRAGAGLGTRALGRACRRWAGVQAGAGHGQTCGARSRRACRQGGRHAGRWRDNKRTGERGARGTGVGRAACAHRLGQLGQLGARALGLVFNLVFRLGIFPESLNEHCSL